MCELHFSADSMVLVSLWFGLGEGGYLKDYEWVVGDIGLLHSFLRF